MNALKPNLTLRRATAVDVPAIRSLVRKSFKIYIPRMGREPSPMREDFQEVLHRDFAWVVEGEDGLAAVMVLKLEQSSVMLDLLAVDPACQGQGIGSVLLEQADREALKFGHNKVRLYTHETMVENLGLYSRRGFVETHREEYLGGEVVYMNKDLDQPLAA